MEETRSCLLLENPRYHLGSGGESSMVVLVGTRRYHLGSSGGNSIAPASRKRTLPSWQRWGKLHGACFQEPDVAILAAVEETRSHLLVENPRYHLRSDGGSSRMDASTEATSGLACRGGMTAACSKNAKNCGITGGSEGSSSPFQNSPFKGGRGVRRQDTYAHVAANQKHWPCNRLGRPFRDKGL